MLSTSGDVILIPFPGRFQSGRRSEVSGRAAPGRIDDCFFAIGGQKFPAGAGVKFVTNAAQIRSVLINIRLIADRQTVRLENTAKLYPRIASIASHAEMELELEISHLPTLPYHELVRAAGMLSRRLPGNGAIADRPISHVERVPAGQRLAVKNLLKPFLRPGLTHSL